MKHVQTFEYFGQKFITGHGPGEKEEAKARILSEINGAIENMMANPDDYAQSDDPDKIESDLLYQAKEDKYRGTIEERTSAHDGLVYVVYAPKASPLQDMGAGAAAVTGTKILGKY